MTKHKGKKRVVARLSQRIVRRDLLRLERKLDFLATAVLTFNKTLTRMMAPGGPMDQVHALSLLADVTRRWLGEMSMGFRPQL